MSPKEVWADFVYKGVVCKDAKHGSQSEKYDTWQCPYCDELVDAIASTENRKGRACANHFWQRTKPCPKRPPTDLRGQKAKAVAPSPVPPPVMGQPVPSDHTPETLRALNEELAELRVQTERAALEREKATRWAQEETARAQQETARAQQATARAQQWEAEFNKERAISERRKRERSHPYRQVGVPSPHSSDGEEDRARKQRRYQEVVASKSAPHKTSQGKTPQGREAMLRNAERNQMRQDEDEEDPEPMRRQPTSKAKHKPAPKKSEPPSKEAMDNKAFFTHFTKVLDTSKFAADKCFQGFMPEKHVGEAHVAATEVHKVVIPYHSKWQVSRAGP